MSRIRGKNTKPELVLRKTLWKQGLRYRLHIKLPGRPDIVFVRKRVVIFVDGCFWHGCPEHAVMPKSNKDFWQKKLQGNVSRDIMVTQTLQGKGWKVLRFWEHDVINNLGSVVEKIKTILA